MARFYIPPTEARAFYGPSLSDPRDQPERWATHEQRVARPLGNQLLNVGMFAATIAGIGAAGYARVGNKYLWDHYVAGLRWVEEYSPAQIFRTFQLSRTFSPFETAVRQANLFISPSLLAQNTQQLEYLSGLIGGKDTYSKLLQQGVTLREGTLYWGMAPPSKTWNEFQSWIFAQDVAKTKPWRLQGTTSSAWAAKQYASLSKPEVALKYASAIRGAETGGPSHIGAAYARSLGLKELKGVFSFEKFFVSGAEAGIQNPMIEGVPAQIIGGRNWFEHSYRKAAALGTEQVERFNRLLRAPFEMRPFSSIFGGVQRTLREKFGIKHILDVPKTGGLKMLGALSLKYGVGLGALALGYETLDWTAETSDLTEGTLFEKGITHGLATVPVAAHVKLNELSQAVGLQGYARKQEEIAPGSTSLSKLAAFPLMGLFGATGLMYGAKVATMARAQITEGLTATVARDQIAQKFAAWETYGKFMGELGPQLTRVEGFASRGDWVGKLSRAVARPNIEGEMVYKLFGKLSPMKLGGIVGAGLGLALVAPFLPGALIPSSDPEELKRIYSGQQEVPIRRGRWWEMGRCLTKSTTCELFDGGCKEAKDVEVGDMLVGSDGRPARVVGIFKRLVAQNEKVYRLSCAYNRKKPVELTEGHMVPTWSNGEIKLTPASEISLNVFVQTPIKMLCQDVHLISCLDYIRFPVYVDGGRIYSAQKNWHSKKLQKSGSHDIPLSLDLDYDLGYLFGVFLAEGNISFHKNRTPHFIETVHAVRERYIADRILDIVENIFGTKGTIRYKKDGPMAKEGCWIVRLCSSILAKLFLGLFYPEPYDVENKQVPKAFLSAPDVFKEGLIEGYWLGGGHLDNNARVISSARPWLLEDIQTIAVNLGRPCGISFEENEKKGKYRLRFSPEIDIAIANNASVVNDGRVFSRIRSIEEMDYDGEVYDFEVDHPDHLFQAGAFLVHNSPYSGKGISMYRPHAYALLGARSREKGIWGEDYEKFSPIERWFLKNFTYELEEKHYKDRPYPVSGSPFQDVPFIGPILSATVGRIFKPNVYMHVEDWLSDKGVKVQPPSFGARVATELGEIPRGVPVSPYSPTQVLGEQIYRLGTEMPGLTGFSLAAIKEKLTGSQDWFDQLAQLETSDRMTSYEREYWERDLGGLLGMCWVSGTRILTPHGRKNIEDVKVGEQVMSLDGTPKNVLNVYRSESDDIYEIRIKTLDVKLQGTGNHKIPIYKFCPCHDKNKSPCVPGNRKRCFNHCAKENKNISIEDVALKDLKPNDFVVLPINRLFGDLIVDLAPYFKDKTVTAKYIYVRAWEDTAIAYEMLEQQPYLTRGDLRNLGFSDKTAKEAIRIFKVKKRIDRFNRHLHVDNELCEIIGWYLAEGSIEDSGRISFALNKKENSIGKRLLRLISIKFGNAGSIKKNGKNGITAGIQCDPLARYFADAFGRGAHCKKIPHDIKSLPTDYLWSLFIGLNLGDGWVSKKKTAGFTSSSSELCRDLYDIGLKLGLRGNLCVDYEEIPSKGQCYPQGCARKKSIRSYISWDKYSSNVIANIVYGYPVEQEPPVHSFSFIRGDLFFARVDYVTKLQGSSTVYDLAVEGLSYYIAEHIAVHNSEAYRRLFPHRRRQIELVNPIRNLLPEWLPGPGERGPDLQHADPYVQIPLGESRLPGPGYEALHPELKGVPYENYSTSWRLKILGDVASYTEKYKETLRQARSERNRPGWTEEDETRFQTTLSQVKAKRTSKEFQEYKYLSRTGGLTKSEETSEIMSAINRHNALGQKKPGLFERFFGSYWEALSHNAETALDQLTPVSPGAKLVHTRSPIESYERDILYGSESAFWQHPVKDFIAPFGRSIARAFGYKGVPESAQNIRDIESYFDVLKYVKSTRLSNIARLANDQEAVKKFEAQKDETLFGVNPYTKNYTSLYRALPKRERDYFEAFENAQSVEEKERILEMVPDNEKALYVARWKMVHADQFKRAIKAGILTEEQEQKAQQEVDAIYEEAETEGFPTSKDLLAEYLKTRYPGESYADWYRRVKVLGDVASLPGEDWVAFHPSVDLEDVKLKLVQHLGEAPIPLNLWQQRARDLPYKTYISEETIKPLIRPQELSREEVTSRINELLFVGKMRGDSFTTVVNDRQGSSSVNIEIDKDTEGEMVNILNKVLN